MTVDREDGDDDVVRRTGRRRVGPRRPGAVAVGVTAALALAAAACGSSTSAGPGSVAGPARSAPTATVPPTTTTTTTTTLPPCDLSSTPGTANTVPVVPVCSSDGAPHFATPQAAMTYLAQAWNADDVRELDYVTDPAGRAQMDAMASAMVDLRFESCTQNPAGDDTCYFLHDIAPSTSATTYPDPGGYPPGEAVFTVAPADGPGWYLTEVIHCG